MNSITEKQNEGRNIDRLAAMRQIYSIAKRWFWLRSAVVVAAAAVGQLIARRYPDVVPYVAVATVLVFVGDFILEHHETQLRQLAARIQELFDCELYELPWNATVAGDPPDAEDVRAYSRRASEVDRAALFNWYPVSVGDLPVPVATCICQRSNFRWDSRLRRLFAMVLGGVLVAILLYAFNEARTLQTDTIIALVPLLPLVKILLTHASAHLKAAASVDRLKKHADQLATAVAALDPVHFGHRSRSLQDELFRHRKSAPAVPNFFYWIFKATFEEEMSYSADEKAKAFLSSR